MMSIHFWMFGIFTVFGVTALVLSIWLPETAGRALEELIPIFEKKLYKKFRKDELTAIES